MKESITLSPPNSLIFVMDHEAGVLPDKITAGLVAATGSCIAVGTLASSDGETTVTLTDDLGGLETGGMVFDGVLSTPNHELSVCDARNEKLITLRIQQACTRVRIFANDPSEPDQIVIFVAEQ